MKRAILRGGFLIALGLAGCKSDGGSTAKPSKPEDPTAWTGKELTKDESGASHGLSKGSRMQGGWSSEARDIENSLGVGR